MNSSREAISRSGPLAGRDKRAAVGTRLYAALVNVAGASFGVLTSLMLRINDEKVGTRRLDPVGSADVVSTA